jgi:Predicted transcriptional regulator with an HTH domain
MRYDFKKVQEVMNERGMTLAEVGERSGVHYSTVSKALERGTAHQSTAKKICRALRIPFRELLRSGESNAA